MSHGSARWSICSAMTYKITRKLEKSGFLKSCRGTNGGYALNLKLAEISLYDLCAAIDPDILLLECMKEGYPCSNEQSEKSMSGTSRILPAAEYAGAGNETKISCRIISVSVFLP